MTVFTRRSSMLLLVLCALAVAVGAATPAAATDGSTTGPTVSLDPAQVKPDDYLTVTITGFTATYVVWRCSDVYVR